MMRLVRIVLAAALATLPLAAIASDEVEPRRITPEERAQLGPSQLLFPIGWTPRLEHFAVRSAYDPTEQARDASLAGSAGAMIATVGLPIAVVGAVLGGGIVKLNEPRELQQLRAAHAKRFVAIRTALGDHDCRPQVARELDWALSEAHPWLKVERVRILDDSVRGLARAYSQEPVDTLIVVDAKCGLAADLGDARIEAGVEVYSKRFGPLAHAIQRDDDTLEPAVWHEEPVYRNRFVAWAAMPTAEIKAARIAARKAEIETTYGPRLAEARTKARRAELEKWRDAALAAARSAGDISYNEYIELAQEHWARGAPTELQRALDEVAKLLATSIAEDLGKPPEFKGKGRPKKHKAAWVQARPVVLEAKDD